MLCAAGLSAPLGWPWMGCSLHVSQQCCSAERKDVSSSPAGSGATQGDGQQGRILKWQPGDLAALLCCEGHKKAVAQSLLAGSLKAKDARSAPGLARRLESRNGVGSVRPDSSSAVSRAVMVLSVHRVSGRGTVALLVTQSQRREWWLWGTPVLDPHTLLCTWGSPICCKALPAVPLWLLPASTARWDVSAQQSPSSDRSTELS